MHASKKGYLKIGGKQRWPAEPTRYYTSLRRGNFRRALTPPGTGSVVSQRTICGYSRISMIDLKLDLLQTLTLAALVYFAGIELRKRITWLDRLNIPSAVIGGLLFTTLVLLLHDRVLTLQLDTALQSTLSVAFFTSIGMGAS